MGRKWELALAKAKELALAAAKQAKLRKGLTLFLAIILVLQLYFVRELIAAELLFGLGFLVFLTLVGIFYAVGFLGERAFGGVEAGYRATAPVAKRAYNSVEEGYRATLPVARRAYVKLEDLSKKPFRHPRSESAR
jgi:hypothetical protein